MPLGAVIAGAASLVSGLFGRSDAKKQAKKEERAIKAANAAATAAADKMNLEHRARADAAALVPVQTSHETYDISKSVSASKGGFDSGKFLKAAEEIGVNPLTFLRSGGAAMFATQDSETRNEAYSEDWTCTTGERAMDAAQAGLYIPQLSPVVSSTKVPSVGSVVGDALVTGTNQYLNDRQIANQNQHQMDMLNAQLAGQNQSGAYQGPRSGYVPTAFLQGSVKRTSGPQIAANAGYKDWNQTRNLGKTPPAPFEPKTEFDDFAASLDQVVTVVRDAWNRPWKSPSIKPGSPLDVIIRGGGFLAPSPAPQSSKKFRYPTRPGQQHRYGPGGNL